MNHTRELSLDTNNFTTGNFYIIEQQLMTPQSHTFQSQDLLQCQSKNWTYVLAVKINFDF